MLRSEQTFSNLQLTLYLAAETKEKTSLLQVDVVRGRGYSGVRYSFKVQMKISSVAKILLRKWRSTFTKTPQLAIN